MRDLCLMLMYDDSGGIAPRDLPAECDVLVVEHGDYRGVLGRDESVNDAIEASGWERLPFIDVPLVDGRPGRTYFVTNSGVRAVCHWLHDEMGEVSK